MKPRDLPCRGCRKQRDEPGESRHSPQILVLQHADWEVPAIYRDLLLEAGWRVVTCRPDLGQEFPDHRPFDGVLAMGGPMSVNDEREFPWLSTEKQVVAAAVTAGTPFFGVCLGAQILASAFGAQVYPARQREFGIHAVRMAAPSFDDPLFGGLPRTLQVFQWHGETFDLPVGAVLLAEGDDVPHQAMRIGTKAYGLQFHAEVSTGLLADWLAVPSCAGEVAEELGPGAARALTADLRIAETRMLRLAERIFTGWMGLVESGPRRGCPCGRKVLADLPG
ncbi:type 1 glutamine amidotransferase [Lentzea rhizosphaerae]|uniref:Type 1 glutamine amidotransferase n=1 Tax=Lentzea rhizosphaerae TaxID=2041025 RepID=A0ABV8C873_9PSEU